MLVRLHRASQAAAVAFAVAGPAIVPLSQARAHDLTTRAFERSAELWRPISEWYLQPYGYPP